MLRAFLFVAKVALLVFAAVLIARAQGSVDITLRGYVIETSVGFLLAAFAAVLLVWTLFYRLVLALVSAPAAFRRYRAALQREEGYRAVTKGLVAVAAGDGRLAEKYSRQAGAAIPDAPLTRLLSAQTALLSGRMIDARKTFISLLDDKDAAFLGLRGLLAESLAARDYAEALVYMRRAEALQPKKPWVLRMLFDLETRTADWSGAQATLRKLRSLGLLDVATAKRQQQAIAMAQSDAAFAAGDTRSALKYAASAFDLDAAFAPAALRLAKYYIDTDQHRRARKVVTKAWQAAPHPELAELWRKLQPETKKKRLSAYDEGREVYDWVLPLYEMHKEHRDSHRLIGLAALDARLWREARGHLEQAQDYRALARLERIETGNEARAREWLEILSEQPPEPKWVCAACGYTALDWKALCRHCGTFNTAEWRIPSADRHDPSAIAAVTGDILMPPATALRA